MTSEKSVSDIDGLPVRLSGPWIKRKHYYLTEYSKIFTIGMKNKWEGRLTFLDLFSGPGRCLVEQTGQELDGSPLLALQQGFSQYIFVEENPALMGALQTRCSHSPKESSIKYIQDDSNHCIDQIISQMPKDHLSLAFIDPTDIDLHFETIKALSKLSAGVDLIMNIQYGMDLKRNFDFYMKQGADSKLASFMGADFDLSRLKDKEPKDVIEIYKSRIGELGYKTVEHRDISVTNSKNAQMYFLLFASKDPRGTDFWEKITKKDEQGQGELF